MTIFENKNVRVTTDGKCIDWYDLNDKYNDYKGFTRNKRNIPKAVEFIKKIALDERLNDSITMGDIGNLMDKFKLKPHTYCGMD